MTLSGDAPKRIRFGAVFSCAILLAMEQTALYRKYRPVAWEEVRGQDRIVAALRGAIDAGNVSHAYLFSGSRGTGKTTIARIFAKSLRVDAADVYEMDAASNRRIDDVRELREAVRTLPLRSRFKVYIIDEVHMLTKEAFNALLKTLEEPPAHVIFILATTEPEKLPDTIVSRCQHFSFTKPDARTLADIVIDVAAKEKIGIDPAAASLIALLGRGSFRDTLGLLQRVMTYAGEKGKVMKETAEKALSVPPSSLAGDILAAIAENDAEKALRAVSSAAASGGDIAVFADILLRMARAVLILRFAPSLRGEVEKEMSAEETEFLASLAKSAKRVNSDVVRTLLRARADIAHAHIPELPLEVAIVSLTERESGK